MSVTILLQDRPHSHGIHQWGQRLGIETGIFCEKINLEFVTSISTNQLSLLPAFYWVYSPHMILFSSGGVRAFCCTSD